MGRYSDEDEMLNAMLRVAHAIENLAQVACQNMRPHPITSNDLDRLEHRITMKVSELTGTLNNVKETSLKAFAEIRAKIDALDAKIVELQDADLPAETVQLVTDLQAISKQLDDIVPDAGELPPVSNGSATV